MDSCWWRGCKSIPNNNKQQKKKKEKKRNASHNIWITTEEAKHPVISKYLVMSVIKKTHRLANQNPKKNQQPGLPSSSPCRPLLFFSFLSFLAFSLASSASLPAASPISRTSLPEPPILSSCPQSSLLERSLRKTTKKNHKISPAPRGGLQVDNYEIINLEWL